MRMSAADVETLASEVRQIAKIDSDTVRLASDIARRTLGVERVVFSRAGSPPRYEFGRIRVPVDAPDLNYAIAYALALYSLERSAFFGNAIEVNEVASALGLAICAPPHLVRLVHKRLGEDNLEGISKQFGFTETWMTVRLAVVLGQSRAVVTPSGRVLANDDAWHTEIPAVEIASGRTSLPGIRRAPFKGSHPMDRGAVALRKIA